MNLPDSSSTSHPPKRFAQRGGAIATLIKVLLGVVILAALYVWFVWSWSYSRGERAGWVQKLSNKGFICKTWEGEMAMISMPGAAPEKFLFTVWRDEVAEEINKSMGKRVALHYEEKVGLPGSCFGETRHYVVKVTPVNEIPLGPGVVVPVPTAPTAPAPVAPSSAAPSPAAAPAPAASAPVAPSTSAPVAAPAMPPIPGSIPVAPAPVPAPAAPTLPPAGDTPVAK